MNDLKCNFMNLEFRNKLLKILVEKKGYHSKSKKEKSKLLDEYCALTGQNRNYVIRKIQNKGYLKFSKRKRKPKYDQKFVEVLARIWEKFGFPCGKKLEILLKKEVDRLRKIGELKCSDEIAQKLKEITSSTIDLKLRKKKRYLRNRILKTKAFLKITS
jgi:hypothetical protein